MIIKHSRLSKNLIKSQSLLIRPSKGKMALLEGLENRCGEILANGAGQKPSKTEMNRDFLKLQKRFASKVS